MSTKSIVNTSSTIADTSKITTPTAVATAGGGSPSDESSIDISTKTAVGTPPCGNGKRLSTKTPTVSNASKSTSAITDFGGTPNAISKLKDTPMGNGGTSTTTNVGTPLIDHNKSSTVTSTTGDTSKSTSEIINVSAPMGNNGTLKKAATKLPKPLAKDDSDDDCMIIDEINPTKPQTPISAIRKRDAFKEEKITPPSKKMNVNESKRAPLTVPDMLQDLFTP